MAKAALPRSVFHAITDRIAALGNSPTAAV